MTAGRDLDALVVVKPARQPRVDSAGLRERVDDQLADEPVLLTPVPESLDEREPVEGRDRVGPRRDEAAVTPLLGPVGCDGRRGADAGHGRGARSQLQRPRVGCARDVLGHGRRYGAVGHTAKQAFHRGGGVRHLHVEQRPGRPRSAQQPRERPRASPRRDHDGHRRGAVNRLYGSEDLCFHLGSPYWEKG